MHVACKIFWKPRPLLGYTYNKFNNFNILQYIINITVQEVWSDKTARSILGCCQAKIDNLVQIEFHVVVRWQ